MTYIASYKRMGGLSQNDFWTPPLINFVHDVNFTIKIFPGWVRFGQFMGRAQRPEETSNLLKLSTELVYIYYILTLLIY